MQGSVFSKRRLYLQSPVLAVHLAKEWRRQYALPSMFVLVIKKEVGYACIFQTGLPVVERSRILIEDYEVINILNGCDYAHETFCVLPSDDFIHIDLDVDTEYLSNDLFSVS